MRANFCLHDYDFELPEELIAQRPSQNREKSRLLVLRRKNASCEITTFDKLQAFLPKQSLIVANNSTVVPARLRGWMDNQRTVELLLLSPLDVLTKQIRTRDGLNSVQASVLIRPSKAVKPGTVLHFPDLKATVLNKGQFGQCSVLLAWDNQVLTNILNTHGEIPLPPYIKRSPDQEDKTRYQTVYASKRQMGSVAAPTAGLHFTDTMKTELLDTGHSWCELTLFVGYGTFSPIRCMDIRQHAMHAEYVKIPKHTAEMLAKAKRDRQPVIAVGTTSLRSLEGVLQKAGNLGPFEGWLDTYIYPGFSFAVVNGLITNFHLPRSSLLVLVSALAGRERILSVYRKAVEERMRFFSYGDAMLIDMT